MALHSIGDLQAQKTSPSTLHFILLGPYNRQPDVAICVEAIFLQCSGCL